MTDTVLYETESAVATITLNRPDSLNSFDPEIRDLCFDSADCGEGIAIFLEKREPRFTGN